jgi:hypothetical protein
MPPFAPKDPRWRDAYLEALRRTGAHDKAAAAAGVNPRTVVRHRQEDPAFAAAGDRALAEGRAASGLPPLRGWREAAAAREHILDGLRAGLDFKAACSRAGVPLPTARGWRRKYPEWDLRAVEAAAAGGTVLSLTARDCPGRHCGTATGYDWGCFEQQCKDAKSRQVMDARARR